MPVELINKTPFTAELFVVPDQHGQESLLVVLVAVFETRDAAPLTLAVEQRPVHLADVHYGDPGSSSLRYEAELALEKPVVDVLLNARAHAPQGQPARKVDVTLQIGNINKSLSVYGDRRTGRNAEPFTTLPIIYERAFGGASMQPGDPARYEVERRNPIGIGYRKSASAQLATELPNVEYPGRPDEPAGFGAIARGWRPRIDLAGTYDAAWLSDRAPLLPLDYQPLHNQSAPLDQRLRQLSGHEVVVLQNLTHTGLWRFRLPRLDVPVSLCDQKGVRPSALKLDTVLIEPDEQRVTLTARLCLRLERGANSLRSVVLGHMRKAWVSALYKRKRFIDRRGDGGVAWNTRSYTL